MKKIAFIIGFIFQFSLTEAQIVINEGSNKNYSAVIDEEGEYVDWIELYNPTASAIDLYNYSLTKIEASKAAMFVYLIPVFTLILAYFILNEKLSIFEFIACFVILFGVFISEFSISWFKKSK